jgi:hypothetical protein
MAFASACTVRTTVPVLHQVALVIAMAEALESSRCSPSQDHLLAHDYGADVLAITGRARGHDSRDSHEIFVPAGSFARGHGLSILRLFFV